MFRSLMKRPVLCPDPHQHRRHPPRCRWALWRTQRTRGVPHPGAL